ncbi:M4 family metallopeptidase [Cognatilysobacter terrigena]|uniref:M4 family metallopeptidase n=1 Tax=Cognatilysobacter terrigena TaxID=2488749 RepID=UPI00105FBA9B|nr:M4 family metallopeptidase [Lysobacter terrigena]
MQHPLRSLTAAIVAALVVSAPASAGALNAATRSAVAQRALGLAQGPMAASLRRADADAFVSNDATIDRNGTEHVRFARTYRGLPVIGGDFVVHSRNGQAVGVSQMLATTARPDIVPSVSRDRAIVEAGAHFGTGFVGMPTARLVVYARRGSPTLAYEVTFSGKKADQTPTDMHYFVDARTAAVLDQWDTVETAVQGPDGGASPICAGAVAKTGSGATFTSGTVALATVLCPSGNYQLVDTTRGNAFVTNMGTQTFGNGNMMVDADNVWGNGQKSNAQTAGADVAYGVGMTWDYYANVHSRNGIANDGVGAVSRVHYGRNYANAFWSDNCFCMTYGDGDGLSTNPLTVLDVSGHEMSHGVTSRTARLVYSGESGGLNEATSDIFGTMVEFYANNPNDRPDYLIGENVYAVNPTGLKALRYMFKPSLDGASPDCYSGSIGSKDVHYSSGVANHFFYLLAEGAVVPAGFGAGTSYNLTPASLVCNGNTGLVGIGRDAAQKIWYKALTTYMVSTTNYAGARAATLSAATDLYGVGSAQYNAVAAAWSAVSVN